MSLKAAHLVAQLGHFAIDHYYASRFGRVITKLNIDILDGCSLTQVFIIVNTEEHGKHERFVDGGACKRIIMSSHVWAG